MPLRSLLKHPDKCYHWFWNRRVFLNHAGVPYVICLACGTRDFARAVH